MNKNNFHCTFNIKNFNIHSSIFMKISKNKFLYDTILYSKEENYFISSSLLFCFQILKLYSAISECACYFPSTLYYLFSQGINQYFEWNLSPSSTENHKDVGYFPCLSLEVQYTRWGKLLCSFPL